MIQYPPGPVAVTVDITNRCNSSCVICWLHSPLIKKPLYRQLRALRKGVPVGEMKYAQIQNRQSNHDLDPGVFKRILDQLAKIGTRLVQISGEGEPLLHPELFEMIEYAKTRNMFCGILTNGLLISGQTLDQIMNQKVNYLKISVHAGTAELYSRIHPTLDKDVFNRLKGQILQLSELKKRLRRKEPEVILVNVICKTNYRDIDKMIELANEVRAERVRFQFFDGCGETKGLMLSQAEIKELICYLREIREFPIGHGIQSNIEPFIAANECYLRNYPEWSQDVYEGTPCFIGWFFCRILLNGDILPCCSCHNPLGNIQRKAINKIWSSREYNTFRLACRQIMNSRHRVSYCCCNECGHYEFNLAVKAKLRKRFQNNEHPPTNMVFLELLEEILI